MMLDKTNLRVISNFPKVFGKFIRYVLLVTTFEGAHISPHPIATVLPCPGRKSFKIIILFILQKLIFKHELKQVKQTNQK